MVLGDPRWAGRVKESLQVWPGTKGGRVGTCLHRLAASFLSLPIGGFNSKPLQLGGSPWATGAPACTLGRRA